MNIPNSKPPLCVVSIVLVLLSFTLASCRQSSPAEKPANVDYYTCTMHPSVRSQDPKAKCPICSMDLVPVLKKGEAAPSAHPPAPESSLPGGATNALEQPGEFSVPFARQQQIGVTYGTVQKQHFTNTIRAVGMVAYDKQRHWDYVARVEGYVEKLFVFSPGELVEKDAPLLTLYSPDLLIAQTEFVNVLKTRDDMASKGDKVLLEGNQRLVDSVKQRLRLWNIGDAQIAELEKTRKPQERLTLKSPFAGVVQEIGVDQGRRVSVGDHLVDLADLSVVWVWAQFYENELSLLRKGLPVTITTSAYPGEKFSGKLSVIDPFITDASRTTRVRIDVENTALKLRPAMYADVSLKTEMGEGLALPASAVLPTGLRNLVFLDQGQGKLEPRYVELGGKYGQTYAVISGLKEGDRVVTSANFLIDAEAKVQGALRSW